MSLPADTASGKDAAKGIIGAVVVLAIVLGGTALIANFIWDVAHDTSGDASKVSLKSTDCSRSATGAIWGEVLLTNENNYAVIIEWTMNGATHHSKVPANSQMYDKTFSYVVADNCSYSIESITKVP